MRNLRTTITHCFFEVRPKLDDYVTGRIDHNGSCLLYTSAVATTHKKIIAVSKFIKEIEKYMFKNHYYKQTH